MILLILLSPILHFFIHAFNVVRKELQGLSKWVRVLGQSLHHIAQSFQIVFSHQLSHHFRILARSVIFFLLSKTTHADNPFLFLFWLFWLLLFLRLLLFQGIANKLSMFLGIQVHFLTLFYHEVVLFVVVVPVNDKSLRTFFLDGTVVLDLDIVFDLGGLFKGRGGTHLSRLAFFHLGLEVRLRLRALALLAFGGPRLIRLFYLLGFIIPFFGTFIFLGSFFFFFGFFFFGFFFFRFFLFFNLRLILSRSLGHFGLELLNGFFAVGAAVHSADSRLVNSL